ncbi:25.3 kDa heat shock protein- chloroplastic [Striga hermonthica]|uniref:25.3 kDa heat shock protein- chloroplastic n=1 Tax=Striga hermonthica TaxID=68872 RepID=A0A9N7MY33_STRHE|nr:25.3 kDa heat shock protein- chloroplastic [Striga hermonthica]
MLSIPHTIPSQTAFFNPTPDTHQSRFSNLARVPISGINRAARAVKAVANQSRGERKIDHTQRPHKQQIQKRPAQVVPIGLWDRFPTARTVQQMMETMERIMDDPYAYNSQRLSQTDDVGYRRGRTPWEIKEAENEYKMRFDMPGMTKEDVKVYVEEKMLVVKAEKKDDEEERNGEWTAKSYGRYSTRIALPENVEFGKIKAEVKDGVLYITVPKASSNAKVFDINVE